MGAEPSFTRGPWCLDGHCLTTILKKVRDKSDPEAKHLCGDFDEIGRFGKIEDARLAHAAPEMFAALTQAQRILAELARPSGNASVLHVWAHCVEVELQARKALAKARGESL